LQKVGAIGFLILAARKLNIGDIEIKNLVEQMRFELTVTPEPLAISEFFDYDSKLHKITS
jgi:hypothetical protein